MGEKGLKHVFFFYAADWSGIEVLEAYLHTDTAARTLVAHEIVTMQVVLDNKDAGLHHLVRKEFSYRVVAGNRKDLSTRLAQQDYHDYLCTALQPDDEMLSVAYQWLEHYALRENHNL